MDPKTNKNNYKSLALFGEINIAYAKYNDAIDLFNRRKVYDEFRKNKLQTSQ